MRCSSPHWRCDLMMKLPPQVNTAFEMLEAAGYEAYLVGGAVRDYVRDNSPAKDWDITTNALPEQVEEIFTGYHLIETGLKHGTVTVVIDQEPLEITTYRVDGDYSDHRHPDSVSFTRSLKDDLERRDFTMNALAYNPRIGVVDFVGGKADIAGDLVRCVGDPDRRFQEDGLRMLRALRFASVYGMTIEAATAAAIHRNKHLLKGIAAERILVELTKMLCAQGAAGVLRDFADVLAVPIPELTPMFGFPQHNPHHDKDVWDHTIAVIESITPEPVLRWAALLHDIGKPSCFSLAEDGIGHFFGHSDQSTSMAESMLWHWLAIRRWLPTQTRWSILMKRPVSLTAMALMWSMTPGSRTERPNAVSRKAMQTVWNRSSPVQSESFSAIPTGRTRYTLL